MFVKLTNGVPEIYTIGKLRRDNPRTSFPKDVPLDTLASYSVYPLHEATPPDFEPLTHVLVEGDITYVDDKWTKQWEVNPLPEAKAASNTRERRNALLSESDWTQVADAPVDTRSWQTYRQELRDITAHPNFPWLTSKDWPVAPN